MTNNVRNYKNLKMRGSKMVEFNQEYRRRLEYLSSTNIADALDSLGMHQFAYGIVPLNQNVKKIIGKAITIKITAAGMTKTKDHMCHKAIDVAKEGDVIVIDNGGNLDFNCWGGVAAFAAKYKGVSGTVVDGACRDIDEFNEYDYPVFARGRTVITARGRLIEEGTNVMIRFQGVQVRPGDIVVADDSGVVFIPIELLGETVEKAEKLYAKEQAMISDLATGMSMPEVGKKYSYEQMLQK